MLRMKTWRVYILARGVYLTVRVGSTQHACLGDAPGVVGCRDILVASHAGAIRDAAGPWCRIAVDGTLVAHAGPAPVAGITQGARVVVDAVVAAIAEARVGSSALGARDGVGSAGLD